MFKSKAYLCFGLLIICISHAFADTSAPTKKSDIKFDSKRRFTCAGYSLGGPVPELDGDTKVYKQDTDTYVCTNAMGVGKCANGSYCQCPPSEWYENDCWATYGKHRQNQFDFLESTKAKPSPAATPPN